MALQPAGDRRGLGLSEPPGPDPGGYLLILRVPEPRSVEVGALGTVELARGRHAYAGSALGPGGVRARLRRHLREEAPRHWHVDHLRRLARPDAAWWVHAGVRLECRWAAAAAGLEGARRSVAGFGASDCGCDGHLVRLPETGGPGDLRRVLEATVPGGARLRRAAADRLAAAAG